MLVGWVREVTGVGGRAGRLDVKFEGVAGGAIGLGSRAGQAMRGAGRLDVEAGGVFGEEGKAVELSVVVRKAEGVAGGEGGVGGEPGEAGEKVSFGAGLVGCEAGGVGRAKAMGEPGRGAGGASRECVEAAQVFLEVYSSVLEAGGAGLR